MGLHKSQWTLQDNQKWASKWLSAHNKSSKEPDSRRKRHKTKFTKSRKTNISRRSRYSLKQYVQQEIEAVTSVYDKTYYPLQKKKKSSHKSTKTTKPKPKPKSKESTKVPPVPIPVRVASG